MKFSIALCILLCACAKPAENGAAGQDGIAGSTGHNSLVALVESEDRSCITLLSGLDHNNNSILEAKEVSASHDICDGEDLEPDALSPIALIDPCGDYPGIYDEIFIKLRNGQLIASFSDNSNGKNTRFSLLSEGSYVTTDGSNCFFSLDAQGNIFNAHY